MPFVITEGKGKVEKDGQIIEGTGKMCDKAEDPSWIHEHNIPLDYKYYFEHQLQKPVCDLLEPLVGQRTFETIFRSVDFLTTRSIASYFKGA